MIQPGIGRRSWTVEVEHIRRGRDLREFKNAEVMLLWFLLVKVGGQNKGGRGGNGGWRLDPVWWGSPGQGLLPVRPLDRLVVDWL